MFNDMLAIKVRVADKDKKSAVRKVSETFQVVQDHSDTFNKNNEQHVLKEIILD